MEPCRLLPEKPFPSYSAYLETTGNSAVLKADGLGPGKVLKEVIESGLRGRGGAGFPTGRKWTTILKHPCETRFVVCNAAEGEPGCFKDRWLIRMNPYAVIEGMLIAAQVAGAKRLYIAIKASFEKERRRLEEAVAEMKAVGLFEGLELTITPGPEEYLFGEEKAMLEVIEGGAPLPREAHYPPYERGLFAEGESEPNPALVTNVQTYAHVPGIVTHSGDFFAGIGSANTPGTILFTLSGAVRRPGVYEVESGTPLVEVFETCGGGPPEGARWKAALQGVSAEPLPAEHFHVTADFDALAKAGSGLGAAGFILVGEATPIPRVAQMVARFLYVESCSQCPACKVGLEQASTGLDRLVAGEGEKSGGLDPVIEGARHAPQGNRCYLPVQGSRLIPALVAMFPEEFEAARRGELADSEVYPIPKIADFDEARGEFVYDERQMLKEPDWSYREPKEEPEAEAEAEDDAGER